MTGPETEGGGLSPAVISGLIALSLASLLAVFHPPSSVIPLASYVLICLGAPFFPTVGFFLPVYSRGRTGRSVVAITFDDGPDPETTPLLLELLCRYHVKATFFVTGTRVKAHGDLISAILGEGHDIGNHSFSHDVFLMFRTMKRLAGEVAMTQRSLQPFGVVPLAFRPPVGITNPRLGPVLRRQGLFCVNFSCRAYDGGNRFVRGMAGRILKKVKSDDIIVLHDVPPGNGVTVQTWLEEVASVLSGLEKRGLSVIPLAELLGRPIIVRATGVGQ